MITPLKLILLVVMLAGCSFSKYVPPETGNAGEVTFKWEPYQKTPVSLARFTKNINKESDGEHIGALNIKAIGVPFQREITIKIPARERFRFQARYGLGLGLMCIAHYDFLATPHSSYQALIRTDCGIDIFRINPDGSRIPEVSAQRYSSCIDSFYVSPKFNDSEGNPAVTCSDTFVHEKI